MLRWFSFYHKHRIKCEERVGENGGKGLNSATCSLIDDDTRVPYVTNEPSEREKSCEGQTTRGGS